MASGAIRETIAETVLGSLKTRGAGGADVDGGRDPAEERITGLGADISGTSVLFLILFLVGAGFIWREGSGTALIILWGLAFMACGGATGFLFGVPKILQSGRTNPVSARIAPQGRNMALGAASATAVPRVGQASAYQQLVNTNLEEISDWLTKIIVGLGLANLKEAPHGLSRTADYIVAGHPALKSLVTATIIYFAVIGFLYGYLLTRLALQRAFARADQAAADQRFIPNDRGAADRLFEMPSSLQPVSPAPDAAQQVALAMNSGKAVGEKNMTPKLDQTKQDWINNLDPADLGTGIFLLTSGPTLPTPNVPQAVQKLFAYGLTYQRCKEQSNELSSLIAFKWVPDSASDPTTLSTDACGAPCDADTECVNTGCICDGSVCR